MSRKMEGVLDNGQLIISPQFRGYYGRLILGMVDCMVCLLFFYMGRIYSWELCILKNLSIWCVTVPPEHDKNMNDEAVGKMPAK